jgi:PAS domain S-box-containing protein
VLKQTAGALPDLAEQPAGEEHMRLMAQALEQIQEAVVITGPELGPPGPRIEYVNAAFTRITGYSRDEVLGETPRILQGAETDPSVLRRLRETLAETGVFEGETINYRKDGSSFLMCWHVTPIRDEKGETVKWLASQRDVTAERQLEQQILEVQAGERERIARELHDGLFQQLHTISLYAGMVRFKVAEEAGVDVSELDKIIELAKQAAAQARAFAHDLAPVEIQRIGLLAALQRLAATVQETHSVRCTFTYEDLVLLDDAEIANHLLRIAQEAVNNAVRHSGAGVILIALSRATAGGDLTLTVRDNGCGIPDEAVRGGGFGMESLRRRTALIDATLSIQRHPKGGTMVMCTLPARHLTSPEGAHG